jgi:hypothetical protein
MNIKFQIHKTGQESSLSKYRLAQQHSGRSNKTRITFIMEETKPLVSNHDNSLAKACCITATKA